MNKLSPFTSSSWNTNVIEQDLFIGVQSQKYNQTLRSRIIRTSFRAGAFGERNERQRHVDGPRADTRESRSRVCCAHTVRYLWRHFLDRVAGTNVTLNLVQSDNVTSTHGHIDLSILRNTRVCVCIMYNTRVASVCHCWIAPCGLGNVSLLLHRLYHKKKS